MYLRFLGVKNLPGVKIIGVRVDPLKPRAGSSMRLVRLKPHRAPEPRWGPGPPGTTKIYKLGPPWAQKFLERKFAVF